MGYRVLAMSFKNLSLLFLSLWVFSEADAGYYNMGAMLQGPKLVFSTPPSSSVTVSTAFPVPPSVSIVKPNGTVVSTATDSVTLTAHTDAACTIAASSISATTNPKPAVSGVAAFTSVIYNSTGKIYLKAKASGKKPACSSAIIVSNPVTPSPNPTLFKFTLEGPSSIGTNNCSTYNVVLKDEYNNIVTTTSSVTVDYTGAGTGSFYSNSGCTTTTTSGTITANTSQTIVYYKTNNVETNVLQATDPTSQVMNGSLTVDVTGFKLTLSGPKVANTTPTCIGPYTINYLTAAGATAGVIAVSVARNTFGSETMYSDSGCTANLVFPATVNTNGAGIGTFYFKGPTILPTSGPITLTASATGAASASISIGIGTGTTITKLGLTGASGPITSRCTAYTVTTQDASSVVQPVSSNTTVTMTATGSANLYSDYSCLTSTASMVIPAGYSQGTFYFKNTVSEVSTITVQSSGLTQASMAATTTNTLANTKIVSGSNFTCALVEDKTVKCWGGNASGQIGNGTTIDSYVPVVVQGLDQVTDISAGGGTVCVIASSIVKCWGYNSYGQLGNGSSYATLPYSTSPVTVSGGLTGINKISVGPTHVCAANSSNVYCWGQGTYGQLGNNLATDSTTPVAVNSITNTLSIAVGQSHSCAVLTDGTGRCWGNGSFGALGDNNTIQRNAPVTVSGLTGASTISATYFSTCAISGSSVKCWGDNAYGQLGNGTVTQSLTPVTVTGLTTATSISSGVGFVCALLSTNTIKCWGQNNYGQIGNNTVVDALTPTSVSGITTASKLGSGDSFACVILSDQTARCWGDNSSGQLGNGNTNNILTPSQVPNLTNVIAAANSASSTCALLSDKTIKCWGSNSSSTLGNGTTLDSSVPVAVTGISTATAISGGGSSGHMCALLTSQGIKCWGYNGNGQLGNNSTTTASTPVDVSGITTATAIASGHNHVCALLANQTVKCWGNNVNGQLGDGTTTQSLVPVDVSGITTAVAIASGFNISCALLSDQTIKCWGLNSFGQLGNNALGTNSSVPVTVSGISNAISLSRSSGSNHMCAVLADQTAKCWGKNTDGQLGNNAVVHSGVPVAVVGLNSVYSMSLGLSYSCAIITDKSMRCWGINNTGQLGIGNTTKQLLPTPVLSQTPFLNSNANNSTSCAVNSDQTLSCWGFNSSRQTGTNFLTPGFVLNFPQ
jgi:alpha-tubulin suppressor-like RCC1 family protein